MTADEHEDLSSAVLRAAVLLNGGGHVEAYARLRELAPRARRDEAGQAAFLVFRMLGQCARTFGEFTEAREHYLVAERIAVRLGEDDLLSGALEGRGLTELADGRPRTAERLLARAVELARAGGHGAGCALALNAHAKALAALNDDRAADVLAEALSQPGLPLVVQGVISDDLGLELHRQGRSAEAIAQIVQAVGVLEEAGADYDVFKACTNLAVAALESEPALASDAFVKAHDLIHQLLSQVDEWHYGEGFLERVRDHDEAVAARVLDADLPAFAHPAFVEALNGIAQRWNAGPLPPLDPRALLFHSEEQGAQAAVSQGSRNLLQHRYAEAEQELRTAEGVWEARGAAHRLPAVRSLLGYLYMITGAHERARTFIVEARREAQKLGDAGTEAQATMNLISLQGLTGEPHEISSLELLAKARGLVDFLARQGFEAPEAGSSAEISTNILTMNSVLDSLASSVCAKYGAMEHSERYLRRSIDAAEKIPADTGEDTQYPFQDRLAKRLCELVELLTEQGRLEEAEQFRSQLSDIHRSTPEPGVRYIIDTKLGRLDLMAGRWTEATLERLRNGCGAYEELRRGAVDVGEISAFAVLTRPPYVQAAELALHLGNVREAFVFLQQAKSRGLQDVLRDRHPDSEDDEPLLAEEARYWDQLRNTRQFGDFQTLAPAERARRLMNFTNKTNELSNRLEELWQQLAGSHPTLRAHRLADHIDADEAMAALAETDGATLVEFLLGERGIYTITVSAQEIDGRLLVPHDHPAMPGYLELLHDESPDSLAALARHPVHAELTKAVDESATAGPTYLVPHHELHLAPMHLCLDTNGRLQARPGTFLLTNASLLRLPALRKRLPGTAVVAGDPLGDLPHSRGECAHVADALGVNARYGADVTADWLAAALADGSVGLVHLACHAVFDPQRPERSGLVLARTDGRPDVARLRQLATLNWSGTLVVLSSCATGRHGLRAGDEVEGLGRTLLAAGAQAVVTSFRKVPDLSTALLMTWFHERLGDDRLPGAAAVSEALTSAQRRLRDCRAGDLITWACRHCNASDFRGELSRKLIEIAHIAARTSRHEYAVRPFEDPGHWASFAVLGTA